MYVVEDMATDGVMDGWVGGWMGVEVLITSVVTHKRETNAKNLVIKIMREAVGKATESDPNKLITDYISGGQSLTFWSRIAARRIHQPRFIIYHSTYWVLYALHLIALPV